MSKLISFPDPFANAPVVEDDYETSKGHIALKRLIWLYFVLLIIEGALRKWIMPGLANPLLVIRDPVLILIYIIAATLGVFPKNGFIAWIAGFALVSFFASEVAGGGNLLITLYGVRTNFLHLPLIFLLPAVFTPSDVHRVGKWCLLISIPMALLVVAQFRASPDSRLNVGAGGSIGGQIEVGMGKIRPAGTFSYNTGLTAFAAIAAAYIISTQMSKNSPNRKMALTALPGMLMMIAVSGSRATLGMMTIILMGVVFICIRKPVFFGKGMKGLLLLGIAYFALSSWSEFRNGLTVHENRIVTGGGVQQGLVYRVIDEAVAPFRAIGQAPLLGKGLGMGTNVAAGLLFGERGFLLAEGEWERVVLESGPILGFLYIGFRLVLVMYLGRRALASLNQENPLPLLLFCAVAPEMINGQFAVPSTLGFAVFNAGICLAACAPSEQARPVLEAVPLPEPAAKTVRGRSIYAEQLHGD